MRSDRRPAVLVPFRQPMLHPDFDQEVTRSHRGLCAYCDNDAAWSRQYIRHTSRPRTRSGSSRGTFPQNVSIPLCERHAAKYEGEKVS